MIKNSKLSLLILIVLAAIPRIGMMMRYDVLTYSDSATYELPALALIKTGALDFLVRPPLYPLFMGFVYKITGINIDYIIIVQHLLALAAIIIVYLNLRKVFTNQWVAFLSSLIFSWLNLGLIYEHSVMSDSLHLSLFAVNFSFLLRFFTEQRWRYLIITSILTAGMALTRSISLFYGLVPLAFILLYTGDLKKALYRCAVFLVPLLLIVGGLNLASGGIGFAGEPSGTFGVTLLERVRPLLVLDHGSNLEYKTLYRKLAAMGKVPVEYHLMVNAEGYLSKQQEDFYRRSAAAAAQEYGAKAIGAEGFNIYDVLREARIDISLLDKRYTEMAAEAIFAHPGDYIALVAASTPDFLAAAPQDELKQALPEVNTFGSPLDGIFYGGACIPRNAIFYLILIIAVLIYFSRGMRNNKILLGFFLVTFFYFLFCSTLLTKPVPRLKLPLDFLLSIAFAFAIPAITGAIRREIGKIRRRLSSR